MSAAAPTTAAGGLFGWMWALPQLPLSLPSAPVMHFSTRGLFAPAAMGPPSSCSGDDVHVIRSESHSVNFSVKVYTAIFTYGNSRQEAPPILLEIQEFMSGAGQDA
jgi:hypothetical protein